MLLLLLLPAAACSEDPTGADAPDPQDLIAWQQGEMVVGKVILHCGEWFPEYVPGGDPVLVDLLPLPYGGSGATPDHGPPTAEQIARVEEYGAEVVHAYNLLFIRARVPRSLIGDDSSPLWFWNPKVRVVVQEQRFDVFVTVVYEGDIEAVQQEFEALGGVVNDEWPQVGTFTGVISDTRIPELRQVDGVHALNVNSAPCLA